MSDAELEARLLRMEGALRIMFWNELRLKGTGKDKAIQLIEESIAALKTGVSDDD